MSELHVLVKTETYLEALKSLIPHRDVLELGVGTGALTKLILEAGAKSVVGYEILPNVCEVKDPRFSLHTADYTSMLTYERLVKSFGNHVLVANPAYSTLPFIKEHVLPHIDDAILMVGEKYLAEFQAIGFRALFWLTGDAFEPKSKGMHYVLARGLHGVRFVDLHHEVTQIDGPTMFARVEALAAVLPSVALCGIGGFPFRYRGPGPGDGPLMWCGMEVTRANFKAHILDALGLSATLTYMNKSKLSLWKLGTICAEKDHTWAYNWITATAVFAGHRPEVHLAFARDTRFKLGWVVEEHFTGKVFTASAPLKHWIKFTSKKDDKSYDKHTRQAMAEAQSMIEGILP